MGIGSDGLAVVEQSDCAPVRMRIFDSDDSGKARPFWTVLRSRCFVAPF
jgi:hypothetical protein